MNTTSVTSHTDNHDTPSTATEHGFRVAAISDADLARIRSAGHDDYGNPLEVTIDQGDHEPLRCCLRPSDPGEQLALIAYSPFGRPGPYAEVGPVFVHAGPCDGYLTPEHYPEAYRTWPTMIFRPYDAAGRMVYSALAKVDGPQAEAAVEAIFADPVVEVIHARNVMAGCFMFSIQRPHLP